MGKWVLRGVGLVVVVVVGLGVYVWFSGGSGEPSTSVTAASVVGSGEAGSGVVYSIDQSQSEVSFAMDEVLQGTPMVVVGTTNEVAGEVLVDFDDPANSRLGDIVVNVRTLTTGNDFRDRAIRGPILNSASDEFEFATFVPSSIDGIPDAVTVGDALTLVVNGDFTVAGVTSPVSFDVGLTLTSETQISVSGTATVSRSEFGLTIPNAPGVANVSENVVLGFRFVALAP